MLDRDAAKDRLVGELSNRIGSLGVEMADISGNLDEVARRVSTQAEQFKGLHRTSEMMVAGNRDIDRAARNAQAAAFGLDLFRVPRRRRCRSS